MQKKWAALVCAGVLALSVGHCVPCLSATAETVEQGESKTIQTESNQANPEQAEELNSENSESVRIFKIARVLSAQNGISEAVMNAIYQEAVNARNEASKHYGGTDTDSVNQRDALRHFAWNYLCVKGGIAAETMRIFTANYEWADVLYKEGYRVSINSDEDIINRKNQLEAQCASSCATYWATFMPQANQYLADKSHAMDWLNNQTGRQYAVSHSTSSVKFAFDTARNNGDIIINWASDITGMQAHSIWTTNLWYTSTSNYPRTFSWRRESVDDSNHNLICNGCGVSELRNHNIRYTDLGTSTHKKYCLECSYSLIEAHKPISIPSGSKCSNCGRTDLIIISPNKNEDEIMELLNSLKQEAEG